MISETPMLKVITNWFKRNFSDPEALGLFFTLVIGLLLLEFFGNILLPVLISIVLAYMLMSPLRGLMKWKFPHWLALTIVYLLFIGLLVLFLFGLLPMLSRQLGNLIHELPNGFAKAQIWVSGFMHKYPKIFGSTDPLQHLATILKEQSAKVGQLVWSFSVATIPSVIEIILYFVLVPILVFFFLKDGEAISNWFSRFLPQNRGLLSTVATEMDRKIGAYIRGRVIEIIIVSVVTWVTFAILGLQYALLIGFIVGVAVIVPYIGAVLTTIPIVILGLMQFGLSAHLLYILIAYGVIQMLDANVLFPLLFSETMDLHPIVIILSVLFFGGIWGFWGIFFAIPLATLVKVIMDAWPQVEV